jgi:ribose 1,5-bisphosphate isomerase
MKHPRSAREQPVRTQDFARLLADIKSLRIQGAEAVARAGVIGLDRIVRERGSLAIEREKNLLLATRPTEPMLRNTLDYYAKHATLENRAKVMQQIMQVLDEGDGRIAAFAAHLIKGNGVYFTHCHSSTVMKAFRHAWAQGTRFSVRNTETRPRFQGRITSRELAKLGIPVEHSVDSAARVALRGCSAVFLGADALLADGKVVNKIGSEMVAELARARNINVYVLAHSWKFARMGSAEFRQHLERRDPAEIWRNAPHGVTIQNHAFEILAPHVISAVITEHGIHDPRTVAQALQMRRKLIFPTEKNV